jgi:hypothetical protein
MKTAKPLARIIHEHRWQTNEKQYTVTGFAHDGRLSGHGSGPCFSVSQMVGDPFFMNKAG